MEEPQGRVAGHCLYLSIQNRCPTADLLSPAHDTARRTGLRTAQRGLRPPESRRVGSLARRAPARGTVRLYRPHRFFRVLAPPSTASLQLVVGTARRTSQ